MLCASRVRASLQNRFNWAFSGRTAEIPVSSCTPLRSTNPIELDNLDIRCGARAVDEVAEGVPSTGLRIDSFAGVGDRTGGIGKRAHGTVAVVVEIERL